jgi:hypothetical protein
VFYDYALLSTAMTNHPPTGEGLSMYAAGDLDGDSSLCSFYVTSATNEILKEGAAF